MGYMRHHAIVVTHCDENGIETLRTKAIGMGMSVSSILLSPRNGYHTFLVGPDGSKEGWDGSERGDEQRKELVAHMESLQSEAAELENGAYVEWAEVQYADEAGDNFLVSASKGIKAPGDQPNE